MGSVLFCTIDSALNHLKTTNLNFSLKIMEICPKAQQVGRQIIKKFSNSYLNQTHKVNRNMPSYRVYFTDEFAGLKLAIFDHFCGVLVTYKGIPPYISVYFLSRFGLISGGSKIGVKKAEIRQ